MQHNRYKTAWRADQCVLLLVRNHPASQGVENTDADLLVGPSTSSRYMKRMVGIRKPYQRCLGPKFLGDVRHESRVRKCVALSLKEQHGNAQIEQVTRPHD